VQVRVPSSNILGQKKERKKKLDNRANQKSQTNNALENRIA
jgi:hypothetical protein